MKMMFTLGNIQKIFYQDCKTETFISSSIYDNEILLKANRKKCS